MLFRIFSLVTYLPRKKKVHLINIMQYIETKIRSFQKCVSRSLQVLIVLLVKQSYFNITK